MEKERENCREKEDMRKKWGMGRVKKGKRERS